MKRTKETKNTVLLVLTDGKGEMRYADGTVENGLFKDGEFVG